MATSHKSREAKRNYRGLLARREAGMGRRMRLETPFVILDDARAGTARLFRAPVRVLEARDIAQVREVLDAIRAATGEGLHAAGFLAYEAAPAFGARLAVWESDGPLAWFGLFERAESFDPAMLPDPAGAWAGAPEPLVRRDDHAAAVGRVLELIRAGDIYQANLTFRAEVPFEGDPLALYARLRRAAASAYGAVIATGKATILSLSPELFFRLDDGALLARPMKGTAARGATPAEDRAAVAALAADPKQRAENLMIVDLLRNDLSRVATPGSVAAPRLFAVETYPTVHQMVSDVTAELAPDHDAIDVLEALFPCGSITGAPKVRASDVIAKVETSGRGLYTGAIGHVGPDGDAVFNVAIRTLTIPAGEARATLGLGSGIVADSDPAAEWAECLAKGAFVTAGARAFDLIETMAFDPNAGIPLLERHLARMKASAAAFGFPFNRHDVRNDLQAATFRLRNAARVRLLLAPSGAVSIEVAPAPLPAAAALEVALAPLPVAPADFRLRHKTTDRGFHDRVRAASGTAEIVFVDPDGFLTEGSFTSIFVARGGLLLTPPLSRGLLPGVLREELIATGRAIEHDLRPDDLAGGFLLGNALRGLMPAVVKPDSPRL